MCWSMQKTLKKIQGQPQSLRGKALLKDFWEAIKEYNNRLRPGFLRKRS
jgi:hypothetical protein